MNRITHRITSLAAASLLASTAHAQLSISGDLDLAVIRDNTPGAKVTKLHALTSGSHLRIAGSEDMGGGLTAFFALKHRFNADTGLQTNPASFWHAEAAVGLRGGFGSLKLGRALDVIGAHDWKFDAFGNYNRVASLAWNYWNGQNGNQTGDRINNGVFYDSPTMGGVALHLAASPNETPSVPNTQGYRGISVTYDQGPVSALLGTGRTISKGDGTTAGISVEFGQARVMAGYNRNKARVGPTEKNTNVGMIYMIGATTLKASYGESKRDSAKATLLGLGANYAMSKRTSLELSLGAHKNKWFATNDARHTDVGAGVYHTF